MAKALARAPGAEKRGQGRPTLCTTELMDEICDRISLGETLIEICDEYHIPNRITVIGWINRDRDGVDGPWKGFSDRYRRARETAVDQEVDELKIISNRPMLGTITIRRQSLGKNDQIIETQEIRTADMIEHRKLQIHARQWRASKIAYWAYGDGQKSKGDGSNAEANQIILNGSQFEGEQDED